MKRKMARKTIMITSAVIAMAGFTGCSNADNGTTAVETMATAEEPENMEEDIAQVNEEAGQEDKEEYAVPENENPAPEIEDTMPEEEIIEDTEENIIEETKEEDAGNITPLDADMYTTADVNLRKSGTVESDVLRVVAFGTQVHVTGLSEDKKWNRISDEEYGEAYISSSYLSNEKPEPKQQAKAQQNSQTSTEFQTATESTQDTASYPYGKAPEGVPQSDWDAVMQEAAKLQPYTGPTGSSAMGGTGSNHGYTLDD